MNFTANLLAGWIGFLAGALTGAAIGLFFHREEWLGGYGTFRRRLVRLGHAACFGIGLINILFALSAVRVTPSPYLHWGSNALVVAMVAMPLTCFLSAWKPTFRHFFFVPVATTCAGILAMIFSLS